MKIFHLEIFFVTILLSLFFVSTKPYKNSEMKKFLSFLGLPDIPLKNQHFDKKERPDMISFLEDENQNKTSTEEVQEPKNEGEKKEEEKEKNLKIEGLAQEEGKTTVLNIKCLWVDKLDVYSLQFLQSKDKDYEKEFEYGKVIFNFCQNTLKYPNSTVMWEKKKKGEEEIQEIIQISGSIEGDNKNKNEWDKFTDDDDGKSGLKIKLTKGEMCNGEKKHQTFFKVYCDPEIEDSKFLETIDLSEFNPDTCNHYIMAKSIYGCALTDWYLLKRLMNDYKIIFVIAFILIGLFLCLFGKKFEKITIIVVIGFAGCYLILIIVLNFFPSLITTETRLWILLGAGFLVGAFVGFLIRAKLSIVCFLFGAFMGYTIAEFVYVFLQGFITWNPQILYYITIGVFALIGGIIGLKLLEIVIIICTSLLGGYVAMRGVTLIFGHYIDESQLVDLIKNKEWEQLKELRSWWVYGYLGLWVVLTIVGMYIQCCGFKKSEKVKSSNTDYNKMDDEKKK